MLTHELKFSGKIVPYWKIIELLKLCVTILVLVFLRDYAGIQI